MRNLFISQHSTVSIDELIHDQWMKRSWPIWCTIRYLPGVTEANHLIFGRIAAFVSRFDTGMSRTRHKALPSCRTIRCVFSMNLSPAEDTEIQERQNVKGEGAWPVGQYCCDVYPTGTEDIQEESWVDAQFFRTYLDLVSALCYLDSFTLL